MVGENDTNPNSDISQRHQPTTSASDTSPRHQTATPTSVNNEQLNRGVSSRSLFAKPETTARRMVWTWAGLSWLRL
jgi:hypothetical protein